MSTSKQPNTLGNASLVLGIISSALVFGIGVCALTGVAQDWIKLAGTPLWVCGLSSSFLGFLALILGIMGLFGKERSRATAVTGLILGIASACLFVIFVKAVGGG